MIGNFLGTTVVGSYPQPDWLIDREALTHAGVPRVRHAELWRVPEEYLEAAQDDATLLAIGEMERAGVELITDGEIRRESYSNRFATALGGVDIENPGQVTGRSGQPTVVPRVVGPIKRNRPVQVRSHTMRKVRSDGRSLELPHQKFAQLEGACAQVLVLGAEAGSDLRIAVPHRAHTTR